MGYDSPKQTSPYAEHQWTHLMHRDRLVVISECMHMGGMHMGGKHMKGMRMEGIHMGGMNVQTAARLNR